MKLLGYVSHGQLLNIDFPIDLGGVNVLIQNLVPYPVSVHLLKNGTLRITRKIKKNNK